MVQDGNFMGLGVYVWWGEKMMKFQVEIDVVVVVNKLFIFKVNMIEVLVIKMYLFVD